MIPIRNNTIPGYFKSTAGSGSPCARCFPLNSESPTFPNDTTQTTDIALISRGGGKKSLSNMDSIIIHFCFLRNFEQLQLIGGIIWAWFKQINRAV
ncbi:hypothetical protein NC651_019345 [Populus alba x Populus x berolinensis]|nr:hypothetical protein NC651_019345 [Populus alba x Populus x berolinensis]